MSNSRAQSNVWFVIPALNEGPRVGEVIAEVIEAGYNAVLVDDGSTDGTATVASENGAYVVSHLINRGQGAALQTGIDYALQQDAKKIVTFDSDGQHRLEDAVLMLETLDQPNCEVVLGSRFRGKAIDMPFMRRIVLSAATIFTNLTTGLKLTDTHNGLRALSAEGAAQIKLRQDRMAHASEILSIIARKKIPYIEVPVTIVYTEYSLKKGQKLSNSLRILEDLMFAGLAR